MNKNKIIQSICILLPAGVVGVACVLGLGLHPVDTAVPESTSAASQASSVLAETNTVSETEQPETVNEEKNSPSYNPEKSDAVSKQPDASKSENIKSTASKDTGSKVQQSTIQQSDQTSKNPQVSKSEEVQNSPVSESPVQSSSQEESSRTAVRQTSSVQPNTDVSKVQTVQPSPKSQEQSRTEVSVTAEPKRQESKQTYSMPTQESSTAPAVVPEVVEETSYVQEEPAGKYIDGTYKSTAEVNGMDEEGFLYDLEVTVTVSGGEITSISGKIKNDRSEDHSSNEAYVRRAVKKLSDVIIANQGANGVDIISNATFSSNAVLKAVSDVLAQAER